MGYVGLVSGSNISCISCSCGLNKSSKSHGLRNKPFSNTLSIADHYISFAVFAATNNSSK